jgi:hypothetical protein
MTNQSINSLEELLSLIISNSSSYYIEQNKITTIQECNGHKIHSRYKLFSGEITHTLLKQHLSKDINLAIPLNRDSAIVYDYRGKYQDAFVSLIKYFYSQEGINELFITTYENSKIVIYIPLNHKDNTQLSIIEKKIEKKLLDRLSKEWRVLPNNLRPEIGNLFILPRELIRVD